MNERASSHAFAATFGSAALIAATAYVGQRLYDRGVTGPIDPLLVVWEGHVAYYWRAIVATWWGGTGAAIVWTATAGRPVLAARLERALLAIALPWCLALAALTVLFP